MMRIRIKTCTKITLLISFCIIVIAFVGSEDSLVGFFSRFLSLSHDSRSDLEVSDQVDSVRKFHLDRENEEEVEFSTVKMISREIHMTKPIDLKMESMEENRVTFKQTNTNLQHKFVHFDLKGAPLKLEYLKSVLPVIKAAGGTGILVEYEDMFPYEGELEVIKAGNAYDKIELQEFLRETMKYDFEVIPLVQTFGHLEYLLKLESFRELREIDPYPDSICPSKTRSIKIIESMIDQVVKFHTDILEIKWIHVGCDEVYHINQCPDCVSKNQSSRQIFVNHVKRVAEYVKRKYSFLTPLIWDDMLRGFMPEELKSSGLGQLVQPVVWIYATSISALVPHRVWYQYAKIFSGIWIASAFKGASGSTKMIPNLKKYYENHMSWLKFVNEYKMPGSIAKYNFKGIFLTGWSRYHHFAVLCEVFPVSIPSLLLNLLLVNMFMDENRFSTVNKMSLSRRNELETKVFQRWFNFLKCHNRKQFDSNRSHKNVYLLEVETRIYVCDFKESRLYEDMMNLSNLENSAIGFHINNAFKNNGFLYHNIKHNSVINFHNTNVLEKTKQLTKDLKVLKDSLKRHLSDFYDDYVVNEFLEYKLKPINDVFDRVIIASEDGDKLNTWNKRPYM